MAAQNRLRSTLSSPVRTQAFVGSLLPLPRARTSTRNSIKGAGRTRSWTGALAMSSFSDTAECPLLELEAPTENRASATFALDAAFRKRRGVLDVTCIYVGGKKEWPTYHDMGDQTEGVRVFYDPQETSYRELVDFFFTEHNCGTDSSYRGRQYMTGVWWHDEDQKKVLDAKVAELEASGKSVKTYQAEVTEAFRAEEYHQDFYRKNRRY